MDKYKVFVGLVLVGGLAGCTTAPSAAPIGSAKPQTIAQVAGNDFTKACGVFSTAVGYYQDLQFLIPSTYQLAANAAIAGGKAICSAPGASLTQDLANLNTFWTKLQANTKASG